MITGPIFRVELVAAARRRRYFVLRVIYAACILFVLWVTYENVTRYGAIFSGGQTSIGDMARAASAFFYTFSWVQVIGILMVAPAMAVGSIATERERRTIEYLFATDLSNVEIVLGKTVARLLLVGQLVLASVPILFIFRLLGGIPADLLAASFVIAASTAVLVTAISVCVSVWSPRARDAAMRIYRVMAVLVFAPGLLMMLLAGFAPAGDLWVQYAMAALGFLRDLNPLAVLGSSMSSAFAVGAGFNFQPVLRMAAWHAGISVALIALATAAVRRVHLRDAGRGAVGKRERRFPRWLRRWKPSIGDHAMFWKEAFAPTSKTKLGFIGMAANVIVVVVAFIWTGVAFYCSATSTWFWEPKDYFIYATMFTAIVGSGLLLLQGARASSLITIEKERDTWISLASTPLTAKDIIIGKLLGNLYHARWGLLLMITTWVLGLIFDVRFALIIPLLMGTFLVCSTFASAVGLIYSLHSKTSLRAMGLTLITGMFAGGGYMMCCCPLAALGGAGGARGTEAMFQLGLAPCLPFLLGAPAGFFAEGAGGDFEGELVAAYIGGVFLYVLVCSGLISQMIFQFDRAAGRTGDRPDGARFAPAGVRLAEG